MKAVALMMVKERIMTDTWRL